MWIYCLDVVTKWDVTQIRNTMTSYWLEIISNGVMMEQSSFIGRGIKYMGNHDMLYVGHLRNMATDICKALYWSTQIYMRSLWRKG